MDRNLQKLAAWVGCGMLLLEIPAYSRTFHIRSLDDRLDSKGLRGAVIEANRLGGNNTIVLERPAFPRRLQPIATIFRLSISGALEDAAWTGDLDITNGNLTIIGTRPYMVIDARGLGDRVFQVLPGASLTLSNLAITGGIGSNTNRYYDFIDTYDADGGAIRNSGTLILQNCSITGNTIVYANPFNPTGFTAQGGGIYNEGIAQLDHTIVSQNTIIGDPRYNFLTDESKPGGNGGGIYNIGTMVLNQCHISNNSSGNGGSTVWASQAPSTGGEGGGGGGIYNEGNLTLNFCTVNDNICGAGGWGGGYGPEGGGPGGAGGSGGGILNEGSLTLNTCTISHNFCGIGGHGGPGNLTNGGRGGQGGSGGGICNRFAAPGPVSPAVPSLMMASCTVVLNEAGPGGDGDAIYSGFPGDGGNGGDGGGLFNEQRILIFSGHSITNPAPADIGNSLIALNTVSGGGAGYRPGTNGIGFDCRGNVTSEGFNLLGNADNSRGFTNAVHDLVGSTAFPIDPVITSLGYFGGSLPTHELLPGSLAIDHGYSFGISQDERGVSRPFDYNLIANAPNGDGSDIGAFELNGTFSLTPEDQILMIESQRAYDNYTNIDSPSIPLFPPTPILQPY
ncbi:MAG TPA: choice-of-anchor Q domain-containing protein [Desulfuromonadaceae bacterium]|nr:choice-of-anchor Q domain-containing protein [Desulfuromonadaceae bacterium]